MRFDDPAQLRRIILRIMLAALAASALLAVIGVLGNGFDQTARMVGTGITAGVASGLLLAACKLLDFEKSRRAGVFLLAVILSEFILVLIAIWNPFTSNPAYLIEQEFAFTALLFPVCALPAVLFFYLRQFRGGAMAGTVGMAMCAIAYLVFLCAIWDESITQFSPRDEWLWETGWTSWFFGLGAASSVAGIGLDRRFWRWIGLAACIGALGLVLNAIWRQDDRFKDFLIISTTLAIVIGHANIMWLCKLKPAQVWLRWAAFAFAFAAGTFFDYGMIRDPNDEMLWRIAAATGICAGCGTVAVAILTAFNRRMMPVAGAGVDAKEIAVVCPVCHKKQNVAIAEGIGESACAGCGMIISVRLRPPRCPACNYILLMIHSDRCPECGTAIAGALPAVSAS